MKVANHTNVLIIDQSGKGIPYGGTGELRPDGNANYGFKNLKGHPERIATIPELEADDALRDIVTSINLPGSAFATVGSGSWPVDEDEGNRVTGYVEFAFNSAVQAADAGSYFPVFFHFDRALHTLKFVDRVHFRWELMGARFVMLQISGFTVSVTINTDFYPSIDEARAAWRSGLDFLMNYLTHVPPAGGTPLFTDAMNLNQ